MWTPWKLISGYWSRAPSFSDLLRWDVFRVLNWYPPPPPPPPPPRAPGPWFNIKIQSYQYRKSHCGDKTVVRSSYLHNGISYTGKVASLYWISPQIDRQWRQGEVETFYAMMASICNYTPPEADGYLRNCKGLFATVMHPLYMLPGLWK